MTIKDCPNCGNEIEAELECCSSHYDDDAAAASSIALAFYDPCFEFRREMYQCRRCGHLEYGARWYFDPESRLYSLREPRK